MPETKRPIPSLEELDAEGRPAEEVDAAMAAELDDPALDEALADFREKLGTPPDEESRDDMPREDRRGKPKQ